MDPRLVLAGFFRKPVKNCHFRASVSWYTDAGMNAYHESRRYRTGLPVQVVRIRNNRFLAHWHEDAELVYVLEGGIRLGADRESRVLRAGSLAVFGSNVIHYYDSDGLESEIIFLIFRPSLGGSGALWPETGRFVRPFFTAEELSGFRPCLGEEIRKLFETIHLEASGGQKAAELLVRGCLYELSALLYRNLPMEPHGPETGPRETGYVQETLRYLSLHYAGPVSLERLAAHIGISPWYLSRLVRRYTGTGFHTYLNRIRVEKAEKLLAAGTHAVTEVLYECGFSSVRTFNRVYRELTGRTPSETRRGR